MHYPHRYDHIPPFSHTIPGQLCKLKCILRWEFYSKIPDIHKDNTGVPYLIRRRWGCACNRGLGCDGLPIPNRGFTSEGKPIAEEFVPDWRGVKDVGYMRKYGLRLKEARRMRCNRRTERDMGWYEWKWEEYTHSTTSSKVNQRTPDVAKQADRKSESLKPAPFTRLPPEILNYILSFLPKDAELALRFTCPELYYHFGTDPVFSLTYKLLIDPDPEVRQRTFWLRECWRQRSYYRTPPGSFLPCCACGIHHPRPFFSKEEVLTQSGTIACPGWIPRLDISPHFWADLERLLFAAREGWCRVRVTDVDSWGDRKPLILLQFGHVSRVHDPGATDDSDVPEDDNVPVDATQGFNQENLRMNMGIYEGPFKISQWRLTRHELSPSYRIEYDVRFYRWAGEIVKTIQRLPAKAGS
ncbi:MAG: hypothetical protein Q9221_001986 [Calogaya cf. arnoldii]